MLRTNEIVLVARGTAIVKICSHSFMRFGKPTRILRFSLLCLSQSKDETNCREKFVRCSRPHSQVMSFPLAHVRTFSRPLTIRFPSTSTRITLFTKDFSYPISGEITTLFQLLHKLFSLHYSISVQ